MSTAKASTLIYKQFVNLFVKTVWPWIVITIWPILQDMIIEISKNVATTSQEKLYEWLKSRNLAKADTAQKEAYEAEARSASATSNAEAEKQRAVAEVWRQVAEQFRQENEVLKVKLDEVASKSASEFRSALDNLDVKHLIEEGKDATLQLQGSQTALRLPSPTLKEE
jgi:uncharacterized membrane protein YqiK